MNRTKKLTLLVSTLVAVCLLSSCGSEKTPTEEMLMTDVTNTIAVDYPFLTVTGIEVEKSFTQEDTYSATIYATADSYFATHLFAAEVSYLRYDQGWGMDECDLTTHSYTLNTSLEPEVMEAIALGEDNLHARMRRQTYVSLETTGESTFLFEGSIEDDACPYILIKGNVTTSWEYDPTDGNLYFSGIENQMWEYDISGLEGTWPAQRGDNQSGEITISNVSTDGFDFNSSLYQDLGTVHVTLDVVDAISANYISQEKLSCSFEDGGTLCTVTDTPLNVAISLTNPEAEDNTHYIFANFIGSAGGITGHIEW